MSRVVTLTAILLIICGLALVGHPFYTDLKAGESQERLSAQLRTPAAREALEAGEVMQEAPITRLLIPKLGVDTIVVEGTSEESLQSGAGHYSETPLPGRPGNIGIAGHRTTYGKPFADLDLLEPGDTVELQTPIGPFIYEMVEPFDGHANPWVVPPDDWSVVAPTEGHMLTLTTCHPKRSDKQRLVARLRLVEGPPQDST